MSFRLRWLLLWAPLLLVVLAGGAWFVLDAWLESAGGRAAVERVLSDQSGQAVRLAGEFEVVLLPAPGVSGTDLQVRDALSGETVMRGGRYRVALALGPLLGRELLVDSLTVGEIRFGAEEPDTTGFVISELEISGFAVGQPADFRIDLGPYGEAAGRLTWQPASQTVDLGVVWGGFLMPRVALDVRVVYAADGLRFEDLALAVDGQELRGTGCYRIAEPAALGFDLAADRLDLDALDFTLPEGAGGPAAGGMSLDLRVAVDTLVRGDTVARGVVLQLGADPDCGQVVR